MSIVKFGVNGIHPEVFELDGEVVERWVTEYMGHDIQVLRYDFRDESVVCKFDDDVELTGADGVEEFYRARL